MFRIRTFDANRRREMAYGPASGWNTPPPGAAHHSTAVRLIGGRTMRFEIRPIDQNTFDSVYTPTIAEQLEDFIYPTQNWSELGRRQWVIDEIQGAYFFEVSLADRQDWNFSYVFIQDEKFALVRTEGDGLYAFVTISEGFAGRLDEVKRLIAEALRVGGVFLDGQYDLPSEFGVNLPNINAVPNAQFVSYLAAGAK
jgi:hypothetical protein